MDILNLLFSPGLLIPPLSPVICDHLHLYSSYFDPSCSVVFDLSLFPALHNLSIGPIRNTYSTYKIRPLLTFPLLLLCPTLFLSHSS